MYIVRNFAEENPILDNCSNREGRHYITEGDRKGHNILIEKGKNSRRKGAAKLPIIPKARYFTP